jgi:hypothetical protein
MQSTYEGTDSLASWNVETSVALRTAPYNLVLLLSVGILVSLPAKKNEMSLARLAAHTITCYQGTTGQSKSIRPCSDQEQGCIACKHTR